MSYFRIPSGSNLVLNVLAGDGNTGKFPLAYVYTDTFIQVAGSPFTLSHVGQGLYSNMSVTEPDGRYVVVYVIYDDAGHTSPSPRYNRTTDTFDVNDIVNVNAISEGVWRETLAGNVPAGSFGEAVSQIASGTVTLQDRITATRALGMDNLPNLDATISSRSTPADGANAVWDSLKSMHTVVGSYGEYLDVPVSSRQSEANALTRHNASMLEHGDTQTGVTAVLLESQGTHTDVLSIKAKTDVLSFSGSNVLARAALVDDKTGYALTTAEEDTIVNKVWDEAAADHLAAGSTGLALSTASTNNMPASIAAAVWDAIRSGHTTIGTFGEAVQGVITSARAINLDNLDVAVSTRAVEANAIARAASDMSAHSTTLSAVGAVSTKLGTPASASVSGDIAAIKSDTSLITTVNSSVNTAIANIAAVQADTDDIQAKIGTPVASVSADIAGVLSTTNSVKAKTDQLNFSGPNVFARVAINSDKTGYELGTTSITATADSVWNTATAGHTSAGTFGKAIADILAGVSPTAVASAVWEEMVASHNVAGTFGEFLQIMNATLNDMDGEILDGGHGLLALQNLIINKAGEIVVEVNQNEAKIDAINPQTLASQAAVIAEVNANEVKIDAINPQVLATQAAILAPIATVDGKVTALQGSVGALQNNTTVRFIVPERLIKPTVGTKNYQFHLRLYDDLGNPETPDSTPTIRIRRLDTGVDIVLGAAMTPDGVKVGAYFYDFVVSPASIVAPILVEATVVENAITRYIPATSELTEFESDLTAVQAAVAAVDVKVTTSNTELTNGSYGLAALKAGQTAIIAEVNQNEVKIDSLASDVQGIPTTPALASDVGTILAAIAPKATTAQLTSTVENARDSIKGIDGRDITQVYDNMDLSQVAKTADPRFANLDAPVSSRSTLTAVSVWGYGSRELTAMPDLSVASVKSVWDYLASQATVAGSLGKRVADFLDATVSSRAVPSDITGPLVGVAQETTLTGAQAAIINEVNANETLLNTVIVKLNQILPKTNLIPGDPASQTAVLAAIGAVASGLADVDLRTIGIKAKTDNLPTDPAQQSSFATIPTDTLRDSDPRLNNLVRLDVPVSSVGTPDMSNIATKTDVTNAQIDIVDRITTDHAILLNVELVASQIKAKTDALPIQPASAANVYAARDDIISRIDGIGPELTPSEVWAHPTRTITQDPASFGPDISNLATKTDVLAMAQSQYVNKMSTVFNAVNGKQEVIAWAEKDGQLITTSSNCVVEVNDSLGTLKWGGTLASPNTDGVYRFENPLSAPISQNYYIVITIEVDGLNRVTTQGFYTVV
jgi:hypothetical protein